MPPAPLEEMPTEPVVPQLNTQSARDESSSDDDDDFGPGLPPSNAANDDDVPHSRSPQPELPASEAKPRRDDWMTMPPEQDELAARMDPSKQRARGFNTSKGAKAPPAKGGDGSAWHEAPEQKRKRLEDEVMGIARPDASQVNECGGGSKSRRDEDAARHVKEYSVRTICSVWVEMWVN